MNRPELTRSLTKKLITDLFSVSFFTVLLSVFTVVIHRRVVWNGYTVLIPFLTVVVFLALIVSLYRQSKLSSYGIEQYAKFIVPIWIVVASLVFLFSGVVNKDRGYSYQPQPVSVYSRFNDIRDLEFNTSTYSFKESELGKHKGTSYLVFFRFDCSLCKVGMPYLLEHLDSSLKSSRAKMGIQFIDVSTSQGAKIARYYGVKRAATIAEIDETGSVTLSSAVATQSANSSKVVPNKTYLDKVISHLSK